MLSLSQIRRSQDLPRSGLPIFAKIVFVPPGWLLTWAALRFDVSPNQITAFRAALIPISAATTAVSLWGIAIFLLIVVMDHVDGNVARIKDQASHFGKFLDGLVDIATDLALLPALCIYTGNVTAGMIGVAALGLMYLTLYRLPLFTHGIAVPPSRLDFVPNLIFNLRYGCLIPALAFDLLSHYAIGLSALYVAGCAAVICSRVTAAKASLIGGRKSKSAVR